MRVDPSRVSRAMKRVEVLSLLIGLLAIGCGAARPAAEAPPATSSSEPTTEIATEPIEGGDAFFTEGGLEGAFVVRRAAPGAPYRSIGRIDERFIPASTFKVPNTMIGLETGVIPDASFTLPWDGQERAIAAWNRDHDLRSAIAESVVWWYQEVARRVGHERMRELVTSMRFGDADIGGEASIDRFWLEGPLGISPREQVDFLARLTRGELPVSARSVAILRDVMPSEPHRDAVVRWKTGTHPVTEGARGHTWLVGWVEHDGQVRGHFALVLLADDDDELGNLMAARKAIVVELLDRDGLI